MTNWNLNDGGKYLRDENYDSANTTAQQTLLEIAINTKGAWKEWFASVGHELSGLRIRNNALGIGDHLVDVGIGASGSEKVLLPNLLFTSETNSEAIYQYFFPIRIPSGSRISVRTQKSSSDSVLRLNLDGDSTSFGSLFSFGRVTDYGTDLTDSGGIVVDPGGVAHTKGSWAEITASTTNPCKQIVLALGNRANTAPTFDARFAFDIGIGSSGAEIVILEDLPFEYFNDNMGQPVFGPFNVDIPAGTRIAARSQSSIIDATDRLLDVIIYGVD